MFFASNDELDKNELKKLIDQLLKTFILLGDFNSNNILCRCKDTNKKGKTLENFINKNDIASLMMHLHTSIQLAATDLSLCYL